MWVDVAQGVGRVHPWDKKIAQSGVTGFDLSLQETDELEDEKSRLQKEIAELQKEKEKLELVLEAHRPICKIEDSDSDSDPYPSISSLGAIKLEPEESSPPGPSTRPPVKMEKPKPRITIPTRPVASPLSLAVSESESLHTPVLTSTPSLLSFTTAGTVFTYPSASSDPGSSVTSHQQAQAPQPCGIAHRRSSSSGDQSDHSLHSPTILTLWRLRGNADAHFQAENRRDVEDLWGMEMYTIGISRWSAGSFKSYSLQSVNSNITKIFLNCKVLQFQIFLIRSSEMRVRTQSKQSTWLNLNATWKLQVTDLH